MRGAWVVFCVFAAMAWGLPVHAQSNDKDWSERFWLDRSSGVVSNQLTAIALHPTNPRIIYVGGDGFVARSDNGAISWTPSLFLLSRVLVSAANDGTIGLDADDIEAFDAVDAAQRFEDLREEVLDELGTTEDIDPSVLEDLILERSGEVFDDAVDVVNQGDAPFVVEDDRFGLRDTQALDTAGTNVNDLLDEGFELLRNRAGLDADTSAGANALALVVWRLAIDPDVPDDVYAATTKGLFRSRDRGIRWERLYDGLGFGGQPVFDVATSRSGQTILAGAFDGLHISTDSGRTWRNALGSVGNESVHTVTRGTSPDEFYVSTDEQLYVTKDSGQTWTRLSTEGFQGGDVQSFVVLPQAANTLLVATRRGLFSSTDQGTSWQPMGRQGLDGVFIRQLIAPRGDLSTLLISTPRGAFASTDQGQSWVAFNKGLPSLDVGTLTATPDLNDVWMVDDEGIFQAISDFDATKQAEVFRRLQEIWTREATPAQIIIAALRFAGLDVLPGSRFKERLYTSNFLPSVSLRLRAQQNRRDEEFVTYQWIGEREQVLADIYRQRRFAEITPTNFEWEVLALWDLSNALTPAAEFTIENFDNQLKRRRNLLVQRVLRLILKRRQWQLRLAAEPLTNTLEDTLALLQLEELTANLDALTGGFFSATLMANQ